LFGDEELVIVACPIPNIFIALVCPGSLFFPMSEPLLDLVFRSSRGLFFISVCSFDHSDPGMGLSDLLSVSTKLFKFS
jgi:hypothetical protein